MPDLEDHGLARKRVSRTSGATEPAAPSRRSVLRVAAGAGAAGIAATALSGVVGGMAAQASAPKGNGAEHGAPDRAAGTDPLVVHVRDAAAGEIDVFRGTTQTRLHDRDLAARIVRASR
ncbi:MAG TPA: hypothetical protein VN961_20110 [Streptosporangiaceae bacterium]|nr:hypothetical protein [Streptosporangiaceae bacterium]